jgi:hypothetical protein
MHTRHALEPAAEQQQDSKTAGQHLAPGDTCAARTPAITFQPAAEQQKDSKAARQKVNNSPLVTLTTACTQVITLHLQQYSGKSAAW